VPGELEAYRRKRDPARTPEPVPSTDPAGAATGTGGAFVIQEHHARRLHWDLRLERGGVLVSWAVPKGLPRSPKTDHLAVHTEDHPLEYLTFAGDIPAGEYGGGRMVVWDSGRYEVSKWTDSEVAVTLSGNRVQGRYVLFRTSRGEAGGSGRKDWMVHRLDPAEPGWEPLPELVAPMLAVAGDLPPDDDRRWAYEMKWDGVRAVTYVEGGTVRVLGRSGADMTVTYPEVRGLGRALASVPAVLDGELVAPDASGRPSFSRLQQRIHVTKEQQVRRLMTDVPVVYLVFDVLHLDGRSITALPYADRRELLDGLELRDEHWDVPPFFPGSGADVLRASGEQGLEGIVAKRLDSPYQPGRRSELWRKVKNLRTQEVVVGGWKPGKGRREGGIGSLLLGILDERAGLVYAGNVGTGFTDAALDDLAATLRPLARATSPFGGAGVPRPEARDARWVEPVLVGEVAFGEWTPDGRLRHPSWRGLRPDKRAAEVRREA